MRKSECISIALLPTVDDILIADTGGLLATKPKRKRQKSAEGKKSERKGSFCSTDYKSRRRLADVEQRIKEICQARIRYGYRRVHVLLRRKGWRHGQNKKRRVYRKLGLQLRNKTPKRRVTAKLREDRRRATQPDKTWAMDFVHDQLATGKKIRVSVPAAEALTYVDMPSPSPNGDDSD